MGFCFLKTYYFKKWGNSKENRQVFSYADIYIDVMADEIGLINTKKLNLSFLQCLICQLTDNPPNLPNRAALFFEIEQGQMFEWGIDGYEFMFIFISERVIHLSWYKFESI